MARPKPDVLLESINKKTYNSQQVLAADGVYAVFYKEEPINLRTLSTLVSYPGPKYKKVNFANKGSAFNLSNKLNALFDCEDFAVFKLTRGEQISEYG